MCIRDREQGAMRLSSAIAGLVFGSFFGQVLNRVGIVKGIIKKAAELAGDKPLIIALVLYVAASVIFAGSNGLGMVILVGTIIIPIMLTAGISPFASASILLLANTTGGTLNVSGLAMYVDLFNLDIQKILSTNLLIMVPMIVAYLAFILYHVKGKSILKKSWAMPTGDGAVSYTHLLGRFQKDEQPLIDQGVEDAVKAIETYLNKGFVAAMNVYN